MIFLGAAQTGKHLLRTQNVLNKIKNIFCVPDTKFVSATNVARGQTGKHLCRQQCVRNNVSLFARAFKRESLSKDDTEAEDDAQSKMNLYFISEIRDCLDL